MCGTRNAESAQRGASYSYSPVMEVFLKFWSYSRKSAAVLLFVAVLSSVTDGGAVAAGPSTKVTWKVSSLAEGQVKKLSTLVSTNSPGVKTWFLTKGSCALTPRRKPTKLTMGGGWCRLTLKIAKTKSYPAKTSTKTITLETPTDTTTARPETTTTTSAPTTSTTVAPARTVTTSGLAFTPTNLSIPVGQSVTFIVNSSHDVTWQNGDTGRGATGESYSRRFSNAGTYAFYCSIHRSMTGTITVS